MDESGISRFCYCEYGRALRGTRVQGFVRGRRFARLNIIAGYCNVQIMGEYCYRGSTTAKVFEEWFCEFLLPEARPGDTIIMDNARFHNKKQLRQYAEVHKVALVFLPPYSPDYNPIEHVWANVKRFLRHYLLKFSSLSAAIYWYFAFAFS